MRTKYLRSVVAAASVLLGVFVQAAPPDVPGLIANLRNPDREVRIKAADALALLGPEAAAAIPALHTVFREPCEGKFARYPTDAAQEALVKIGEASVPVLAITLQDRDCHSFWRTRAADALGKIGLAARRALPYLREAAKLDNADVATAATKAILLILPRQPGPTH